jgi:hypothetical protein
MVRAEMERDADGVSKGTTVASDAVKEQYGHVLGWVEGIRNEAMVVQLPFLWLHVPREGRQHPPV